MNKSNKISLYDLYEIKKKKEIKSSAVFNHLLEICYKKIKHVAEHGGMSLYHKIPPIVIGFPIYDYNNCMEYIMKQLRLSGLHVTQLPEPNNNFLYISWKLNDISQKAKARLLLE